MKDVVVVVFRKYRCKNLGTLVGMPPLVLPDSVMCTLFSLCGTMGYHYHVWILNNDDNDIFGETWCASDGLGMCYCCEYP